MKNTSTIINAVLAIAVAILFYLVLSKKSDDTSNNSKTNTDKNAVVTKIDPSQMPKGKIAWIDVDSITVGYEFIKDETKVLAARQQALQSQYESMMMKFQNDYAAFQESAQAGIAPRADLEKKQAELQQKQNEIVQKENQLKNLELDVAKKQEEMMRIINEFILKFNKEFNYDFILSKSAMINTISYANPQLDVTAVVLQGLNEEYRAKKSQKK